MLIKNQIIKMNPIIKKVRFAATVLTTLSLTMSCGDRKNANIPTLWDESKQELTVIRHGIPAYDSTNIVYRRDAKALMNIELQTPVVVAMASKPEGWGYYQFPGIYRSADGLLVATWRLHPDTVSTYGKEVIGFMLSSDNGKTWYSSEQPRPFGDPYDLLIPGSGDRIGLRLPLPFDVKELQLPHPVATNVKGSTDSLYSYYRVSELPASLQGIYLNRWDRNGAWSEIHAGVEDPQLLRYVQHVPYLQENLIPVLWVGDMKLLPDNSIVIGAAHPFYENENGGVDPSGVSFYRSTDDGMNWKIRGKIPYRSDLTVDPNGNKRLTFGFTEPAFEILSDGTFLCVMRTTDGYGISPMYFSRSADQGATWTPPKAFTPSGVRPRLLQLDNGVLVLASGRPGVQIRFSLDEKGEKWTDPFEMLPPFAEEGWDVWNGAASCSYTGLLATGHDSFLVIYSDFKHLNQNNEERKAIKVREIKVTKR